LGHSFRTILAPKLINASIPIRLIEEWSLPKEGMLYERLSDNRVRCELCGRRCLISDGNRGICEARKNENGTLFSLSYSRACSVAVDPIEKKPLFHFHPGSQVLSIASPFCNFFCRFCDNWVISQQRSTAQTREMSPEAVVNMAQRTSCAGISYTYTEPTTFFEWAYDSAKLAHEHSLFNTFVTNGYLTPKAIETLSPYLDAATVDFKGGGDPKFYQDMMRVPAVEPIYDCLLAMKKHRIHIEITNLIVPKYGDSEHHLRELARWIMDNLGENTPVHLLRFSPCFELVDTSQTSVAAVEYARKIVMEMGLIFVYAGNIPGHEGEHTFCPNCHEQLITRFGFRIGQWNIRDGMQCPRCELEIPIRGQFHDVPR
jgi:pyruvate formate lyase activating enzyme